MNKKQLARIEEKANYLYSDMKKRELLVKNGLIPKSEIDYENETIETRQMQLCTIYDVMNILGFPPSIERKADLSEEIRFTKGR